MNSWFEYSGDELEINIGGLIRLFLSKIFWIISSALVFGIAALLCAMFLVTPMYKSSILMYVNNRAANSEIAGISSSDIVAAQHLVETYSVVLTSANTMDAVIAQTGVSYTKKELAGMISTSAVDETEIVRVTVTSADPNEAAAIANAIADIAPNNIMDIITGSSVKIVEYASVPLSNSSPSIPKYTMVGIMAGILLSCTIILIRSLSGKGLTAEDKIRRDFKDEEILASIPDLISPEDKKKGRKGKLIGDKLSFQGLESYRLLRTNIMFSFTDDKSCRTIGVTSSVRGEGKSTTAINMAYALAEAGNKVCLIEGDLRLPSLSQKMSLDSKPGLVNFLTGRAKVQDIIQHYTDRRANMCVIVSGETSPNPSGLLTSNRMLKLLSAMEQQFDYIILDLPPVGIVADALTIARELDGTVFVVRRDFYDRKMLNESLRLFQGIDVKLLGITVTHSLQKQNSYYRYGEYGYGYGDNNNN